MAPTALVQVDLSPVARDQIRKLEASQRKAAWKAITTMAQLDLVGLFNHPGLNFEKLINLVDKASGQPLYSFRFGKGWRAICTLEAGPLVVVAVFEPDHGKAYRK